MLELKSTEHKTNNKFRPNYLLKTPSLYENTVIVFRPYVPLNDSTDEFIR